jgi:polysaccharide biosynthesis transport protein
MSLVQFLRILAARKAIILATLLACFFAATVTVQLLPERYEASNRVLIDMTKTDAISAGGQPLSNNAIGSYIATQLKMIKDVQTAGLVVDDLGWAADANNQAAFENAGRPGEDIREWLAEQIVANTEANFVEASSIIEISYRGNDPATAQSIAQAIREAFLRLNRVQRTNSALRSAASYEEQAKRAQAELAAAEQKRAQFAEENGIVAREGADLETSQLAMLGAALSSPTGPQVVGGPAENPQVAMLRQQIAQAQQTLGPNHPTLQALQRQLSVMQNQGSGPMVRGTSRAEIQAAYNAQKARVLAQGDKVGQLNQMDADIKVKREQYEKLAARVEELKAAATSSNSAIEPLGNTNLPDKPVWPNKPLVIFGSIAVGLVLGVLLALFVELVARRVRCEDDLEYATGAPVLAVVGEPRKPTGMKAWVLSKIDRNRAESRVLAEA